MELYRGSRYGAARRWDIILPLELQMMIIAYLNDSKNALISLCLVSHHLRSLATRELYRSVCLTSKQKWSPLELLYRRRDSVFRQQSLYSDTLALYPEYALMASSVMWQWNPAMTWEILAQFKNLQSIDLDCWTYTYSHSMFTRTPKELSFPRLREATFRGTHPWNAITAIVTGSPKLEAVHFLDMAAELDGTPWDRSEADQGYVPSLKPFLERCVERNLLPNLQRLTLQCYPDCRSSESGAHETVATWVPFLRYTSPRLQHLTIKLGNYEQGSDINAEQCVLDSLAPILAETYQFENLEWLTISLRSRPEESNHQEKTSR